MLLVVERDALMGRHKPAKRFQNPNMCVNVIRNELGVNCEVFLHVFIL